jgi:hypothetical protein
LSEPVPTVKLSPMRVLLVAGVALIAFFLLIFPVGYVTVLFHSDSFTYWYESEIAPCIVSFLSTLTGEITARGHKLGGWIAGGAVLLVFGGTEALYLHVDTTNRPTLFIEFTVLGVTLGIIALYAWRVFKNRKTA